VGEATLGPAAMSLLSDLYPPEKRATVQSVYSAGIPLGAAAALFGGGALAGWIGWRSTFLVLGLPGVLLAAVVLMLPEPARGQAPPASETRWQDLLTIPALRWHMAGYALMAIAANSLSIWIPMLLDRLHHIPLATIGTLTGTSMAIAGGLGTAFGGAIADRWRSAGAGGRLRFSSLLALGCVPLWAVMLTATSTPVLFAAFFGLAGLGLAWLGPAAADVHALVGPHRKGVGTAVYYFCVNMLGYGIAPLVVGAISDSAVGGAPEGLRLALVSAPLCCIAASAVLWTASRKMDALGAAA
jgi:MFS family permease